MTDEDAVTLCAFEEANLEGGDGLAAIVRVIRNRMRLHYASDGTVQGTIFRHAQFSWAEYAMRDGKYQRVAVTPEQVQARAELLLARDKRYTLAWQRAAAIVESVLAGRYHGPNYDHLTDDAVLYLNPELSHAAWAAPDKLVCAIGHHNFYRA